MYGVLGCGSQCELPHHQRRPNPCRHSPWLLGFYFDAEMARSPNIAIHDLKQAEQDISPRVKAPVAHRVIENQSMTSVRSGYLINHAVTEIVEQACQ
jgi:hypothetical protein